MMNSSEKKAEAFLKIASKFQLGQLPTEQSHPLTVNLSQLAKRGLPRAIEILKSVDEAALGVFMEKTDDIYRLSRAVHSRLAGNGRVFLCGCGATGRLSLALERLWRESSPDTPTKDRVISFMAGGDLALIRSVEKFEDYPEYGARQLRELGFGKDDMLIASTEGGETPWVIGACEAAAEISRYRPFFCYCNDNTSLNTVARSRRIIQNPRIECLCIPTGPMALAGSTRMQASTVLMAAAGTALFCHGESKTSVRASMESLCRAQMEISLADLEPLIEAESHIYRQGEFVLYRTRGDLGISVLTDTTERAPTFSLVPFENRLNPADRPSWSFLHFPSAPSSPRAWKELQDRPPRALEWPALNGAASLERLYGFDFSRNLRIRRSRMTGSARHHAFTILRDRRGIQLALDRRRLLLPVGGRPLLTQHLILKMALNIHSTLVMGRMGRYEGNIMTWVQAANSKLVDRAVRCIDMLLRRKGVRLSYKRLVHECFATMEGLKAGAPPVMGTVRRVLNRFSSAA